VAKVFTVGVAEKAALNHSFIASNLHPKAAAAEHRTVKDLLLELNEGKIRDMEKKGLLPKGK